MTVVFIRRRAAMCIAALGLTLVASACGSSTPTAVSSSSAAAGASSPAGSTPVSSSAGVGAASTDASAGSSATPGTVEIVISEANGCVATPDSVPAGAITFHVVNQDAAGVTEVELVSEERIRGERENLAPGFEDTFSVKLDGGSYEIYCPGASTERMAFTVTGEAAQTPTDVADLLQQASVDYADYVDLQTGLLVDAVKPLVAAIKAGDLEAARTAYAQARRPYERVEPVAESFGDLDPAIDARAGDVPESEWTGFHPIEQALFEKKTTKGLDELADKLQADVADLQARAKELGENTRNDADKDRYQPDEVANGAVALLGEVQASKITGEEERYSHIDLLDFAANVEGSQQAFAALKPALNQIDPTVVPSIDKQFDALTTQLDTYKDPSALGGYVLYVDLDKSDTKKLTDGLLAVIEPLSDVSAKIANA